MSPVHTTITPIYNYACERESRIAERDASCRVVHAIHIELNLHAANQSSKTQNATLRAQNRTLLGECQALSLEQKQTLEENEVLRAEAHLRTQQLEKASFRC